MPLLHRRTQHPHTHREQQQLQRDVRLHACPEGGADTGQQTGCLISTVCNTQTNKYSQAIIPGPLVRVFTRLNRPDLQRRLFLSLVF